MKHKSFASLVLGLPLLSLLAQPARAQGQYEFGGLALFSGYTGASVNSGPVGGSVGFQPGVAGGGFLGHTLNDRVGGEIRYLFSWNKMKLSSGGTSTDFNGRSHIVNYDILVYIPHREGRVRPYLAAGGGVKIFEGTGAEQAFQPLSNLALLTKTRETLPTVDYGAGVRIRMGGNRMFRVEFRDYITKVPNVFAAAPGAKISGIMHQWAPAFGFSWTF